VIALNFNLRKKVEFFLYFNLVFLYVFSPYLILSGIVINIPFLIIFFLCFKNLCRFKNNYFNFNEIGLLLVYLIPFMYFITIGIFFQNFDFVVLIEYVLAVLSFFAVRELVFIFKERFGNNCKLFLMVLFLIGVFHALIMLSTFLSEVVRNIVYSFVYINEVGVEFLELNYRSPGLTTAGGDGLSFIQASALVIGVYLFLHQSKSMTISSYLLYIISFGVLVLSVMLSGRTGFIIIIIGLMLILIYSGNRIHIINKKFTLRALSLFVFATIFLVLTFFILSQSEYSKLFFRAFELILNFSSSGTLSSTSTTDLSSMFFLPELESHLLFGNGNYGRDPGLPFLSSDIGYVRLIFGGGLVGVFLAFSLLCFYCLYSFIKSSVHAEKFATLFLCLSILVMNIKVLHYFPSSLGIKFLFLIALFINTKIKVKYV
jgi:hypothetical protein